MKQKHKELGIIHTKKDWLFKEYLSIINLHLKNTKLNFEPDKISKIQIINLNGSYRLIGIEGKTQYILDVNEKTINIQAFNKKVKFFEKEIHN